MIFLVNFGEPFKKTRLKPIYFFIVFLFALATLGAQSSQRFQDSIRIHINGLQVDSVKANSFYNAAIYAMQPLNELELSRKHLDSAMHYARIGGSSFREAKCYFLYGVLDRLEGDYDTALENLTRSIRYS